MNRHATTIGLVVGASFALSLTLALSGASASAGFSPGSGAGNGGGTASIYGNSLFGQTLTAEPFSLADLNHKYTIDTLDWGTSLAGAGTVTHVAAHSAAAVAVGTANADRARLRTRIAYHYQSGKMMTVLVTGYSTDAGQTNQVRRWGYYNDGDGLFFEQSGTEMRVVRRTYTSGSPVDTAVPQSAWNRDRLDGTGNSGVTLDVTKGNIYEIRYQWLGVGTVQYWVSGVLVHQLDNANQYAAPYMKTAVLPVQIEVVNTGASAAGGFTNICVSVRIEGGAQPALYTFGAFNASDISTPTTERPLLTIRPKATFNSVTNRILALPTRMLVSTEGNRAGWRLVINGTLTGASYTSADAASGYEFDVAATALTGGRTLLRGFLPDTNSSGDIDLSEVFGQISNALSRDAFDTSGTTLTVMGVNEAASTTNMRASLAWKEIR
jgi:hypothetical protein